MPINTPLSTILRTPFRLDPVVVCPSREQIFMFSAVTWNRHLIHFSESHAKKEGHADILVQRGLLGNFIANQLERSLGRVAEIRRLSWKVLSSAYPEQNLICESQVTKVFNRDGKTFLRTESSISDTQGRLVVKGDGDLELNQLCL